MSTAADFIMAAVAVILRDVGGEDALLRFASRFVPEALAGRLESIEDIEVLVLEAIPEHREEAREVAALLERLAVLVQNSHGW